MKIITLALVAILSSTAAQAQTVEDFLKKVEALGQEAAQVRAGLPVPSPIVHIHAGESIQDAIFKAGPGAILSLDAGVDYQQSVIIPKPVTGITITTDGCALDHAPNSLDLPLMATVRGGPGQSYAIWVMGSQNTIQCLSFGPNVNGVGEMLRVGDSTSTVLADVPDGTVVMHNYFHGNPGTSFGQKRAIAANGTHLMIDQNGFDNIWVPGQDSQCIAMFSGARWVTVRRNICAAGSENILIGGVPPAGPDFMPADILVEDNVLYKPLSWHDPLQNHAVKNIFEVKIGHNITIRHNWMDTHWQEAQPGPSVVFTMASNGACSYCDIQNILFENNVVRNVSAGVTLTGFQYSYAPGSGQGVGFIIRNNLFVINKATMGGTGRSIMISNEPKDVTIQRNTFMQDGSSIVLADYGTKWPFQTPALTGSIKAGPTQGFSFVDNIVWPSSYGIFTPEGNSGVNLSTYFPGAVVAGNIWGGATATVLGRYNALAGTNPNGVASLLELQAAFAGGYCQTVYSGKGADCSLLPFNLQSLVPKQ